MNPPSAAPMSDLLRAVRRRLWRGEGVAAIRLAAWGTAGLMPLGAGAYVVVRPFALGGAVAATALGWIALLARAGLRRPTDAQCALWADRHLGGQSAFTTWLEVEREPARDRDAAALRWLEQWVRARVPPALERLARAREAIRLARPLAAMIVCTVPAAIVYSLPAPGPSPPPAAASARSDAADRPVAVTAAPASSELVREIASALRSPATREDAARRSGPNSFVAASGRSGDAPAAGTHAPPGQPPGAAGSAAAAVAAGRGSSGEGSGSGREAGDSRDLRAADSGTSRATPRVVPMPRSAAPAPQPAAASQANPELAGRYGDDAAGVEHATAESAVMPATPPVATPLLQLTPTQNRYVQSWLKASASHP